MIKLHKFLLAILGYKVLEERNDFILSVNIKNGDFVIWYVEKNGKIIHYDKHSKDNSMAVKFQWSCLMRGGLA